MLHDRIKSLRTELGLNQPELATRLKVSKQTVSNWENGNRTPDNDMLIKIADYFNVSTDYLLGRTDNPKATVYIEDMKDYNLKIEFDKEVYPDGLRHDDVIRILENLKKAGFSLESFKSK